MSQAAQPRAVLRLEPLFPQDTYYGRFMHNLHVCGPLSWSTLRASASDIEEARVVVRRLQQASTRGEPQPVSEAQAFAARKLVANVLHPDTGEPVFLPFRMCSHIPANALIVANLILARTPAAQFAAQFVNQSFNAGQFFANRNASNPVSNARLLQSYTGAVASAFAAVWLCHRFIRPARWRSAVMGQAVVAFIGAAAAKPMQIGLMRLDELTHGVHVYDSEGHVLGSSRVAGMLGVAQTVLTRIVYLAQPILLPPLLLLPLERRGVFAGRPWLHAAAYVACVTAMSSMATPACIAMFKQEAAINPSRLERSFHGAPGPVFFNKGL